MSNGHSKESETRESVPCVHTTSKHYYGDTCPGHHLEFINLVEPKVVDDEEEPLSRGAKLRIADAFPDTETAHPHLNRVYRERVEAFEMYNSETWNPEEEGP